MHGDQDLLQLPARNVGEYARTLLRTLFTQEELKDSLLPSPQAHRYSKKTLNGERFDLLNGKESSQALVLVHSFYALI